MRIVVKIANRLLGSILAMCSWGCRLVKRSAYLYKNHGVKFLLYLLVYKTILGYMSLLNRISIPRSLKGYTVREILGNRMYLDLADPGISRELLLDGIREEKNVELFRKEVKEGNIVIDIGANIGYYSLLAAKLAGERGKVYAIEPVPSNLELLMENIKLNGYSNIEVFPFAIGDKNGSQSMYLTSMRNRGSLREVAGTGKEKLLVGRTNVKVMTLDGFLKNRPYPNIIRMDVEGYEYEIIKGMKDTLERMLPLVIFIEFHFHLLKQEESVEILKKLNDLGFHIADVSTGSILRGRNRHKLLTKMIYYIESEIGHKLNLNHQGSNFNMNYDDLILNSAMLGDRFGALHICFKR